MATEVAVGTEQNPFAYKVEVSKGHPIIVMVATGKGRTLRLTVRPDGTYSIEK